MSYHRFPNLGKLLQGDLVSKIRRDLASKCFLDRECNCNSATKVNCICVYRGECHSCGVIYKVTCKFCADFYVGNTQNTLKIMEQHFQDVAQKVMNDKNSDSFAAHFTKHLHTNSTTMSQNYVFRYTLYGKPYRFNKNLG